MADKKTCFVIMPFEESYKERCKRIYEPAIKAAGLEPHVAGGDGVDKITEEIENGINNACICLADLSEDNPNVWYELGFALNSHGLATMVCDKEKRKLDDLPFDTKVRRAIPYEGTKADFDENHREGFQLKIMRDLKIKAAKIAESAVGQSSVAHAPDKKDPKLSDFDIKVLGAVIRICSDGDSTALPEAIASAIGYGVFAPLHQAEEDIKDAIWALNSQGFIKKAGKNFWNEETAYKPTAEGKEFYLTNRGRGTQAVQRGEEM